MVMAIKEEVREQIISTIPGPGAWALRKKLAICVPIWHRTRLDSLPGRPSISTVGLHMC